MIKVEKGVPLPEAIGGRGSGKYPWAQMAVGDSFFVEGHECSSSGVISAVQKAQQRYGIKLTTRREGTGRRIWRYE